MRRGGYMGEAATVACQPMTFQGEESRHSNNFCVNQLPHKDKLLWHIITKTDTDTEIRFNVKEHHTYKEDDLRFENIQNGTITPYYAYRNLYISEVKNVTGHFIVRVEAID
ncbi:hypothetical protein [Cellulosilyticum lentocellum]|nr:hypothetical protein [Cellulosilyticum lentocellum]